jgi:hypothetical protein
VCEREREREKEREREIVYPGYKLGSSITHFFKTSIQVDSTRTVVLESCAKGYAI